MDAVCANCGIRIRWQPTVVDGKAYCCLGCAMGGPCTCDYSNLPQISEFRAMVCSTRVIILPGPAKEREPGGHEQLPKQATDAVLKRPREELQGHADSSKP